VWVFSRKKNESLIIRDDITVTVIEIRGDKVRLGIEVPKEVPLHRGEIHDALHRLDAPSPTASLPPPELQPAPMPLHQPDKLDQFAAALQARLSVPVHRDLVLEALREAGIQELTLQTTPFRP
jgi:carbon storage regulator